MIKAMDTADIVNRARESAAECVAELERLRNLNRQKAVEIDSLRAENAELTRKGEELCVAYGNSLMEIAKLKGVVTAAKELEQFLTHDIGMDKLELTYLRQQLAALESPDGE